MAGSQVDLARTALLQLTSGAAVRQAKVFQWWAGVFASAGCVSADGADLCISERPIEQSGTNLSIVEYIGTIWSIVGYFMLI